MSDKSELEKAAIEANKERGYCNSFNDAFAWGALKLLAVAEEWVKEDGIADCEMTSGYKLLKHLQEWCGK